MAQILTSRQADELHKSMVAYLMANNLTSTAASLRAELGLGEDVFDNNTAKKYEGLIEKKWTSVVRLQKKIMDLESRNSILQTELETSTPTSRQNKDPVAWLPRSPPRHNLQGHRDSVMCVAFHPIFTSLASGSDDTTIKIWDWELGELERTVKGHTKAVLDVDYGGPRGNTLLASCSSDLTIKLWDPANEYNNIKTLPGHDHSVSAVRFISSGTAGTGGNLLVSASRDKTLRIWDTTTGFCVKTLRGHAEWVRDVAPSPDGNFLFSTSDDYTGRLWDITVPNPEVKVTFTGHEHVVLCCTIAPPAAYPHLAKIAGLKKQPSGSAEFMATGSRDKTIRLWDARGICLKTLVGHDNWVRALAFHPGGKYLLSVSDDKTLRCWDLTQEGRCVKTLADAHGHFVTCMRWAPSNVKDVPTANGTTAANGEGTNGTSRKVAAGSGQDAQIRCVIATGSVDMSVRIFAN